MYHDVVSETDKSSGFQNESAFMYKVDAAKFEEQVKAIQECEVIFTFDDGGVSFLTTAAPILEKYGKKGVFFISTKYIGSPGFLTCRQVKELEERGHVVGSHSHTHPTNMAELSRDELLFEWSESVKILADILGHPVTVASIPNGYDSTEVVNTAKQAGITELYTSKPADKVEVQNGCKLVGRFVVHDNMSSEYVNEIIHNPVIRKNLYWKWQILKIVKFFLGNQYNNIKMLFKK